MRDAVEILKNDPAALRRLIVYEVQARFPWRWNATAPAIENTVAKETARALREAGLTDADLAASYRGLM